MATKLDILVWDDSFERVRSLYSKYPGASIRKAIDHADFVEGLSHDPTIVILGKQTENNSEQIQQTLEEELTSNTYVLIWFVASDSRELLAQVRQVDNVEIAVGFNFDSDYLWISTYNILNNG